MINGTELIGARPGRPLNFRIPVSGVRPVTFAVSGLPVGLKLDPVNGIISGRTPLKPGDYKMTIGVKNAKGRNVRVLTLRVGDTICLSSPMGWNSWYSYSSGVTQQHIENIGKLMVESGLVNYGWSYVNIDDTWQGERAQGGKGVLMSNDKFPDMKGMCARMHAQGLKIGIYSTPFMGSYEGYLGGSLSSQKTVEQMAIPLNERPHPMDFFGHWPRFAKQGANKIGDIWMLDKDAALWADWGFDYVKMDWNPLDVPTTTKIADNLKTLKRDIVLSLSNDANSKNAEGLLAQANVVRTTGDIRDNWGSVKGIINRQFDWLSHLSPGHYADPDMLQVGKLGQPGQKNTKFNPTHLTPDEQYLQVSFWSIISAPLLMSADLSDLDDFTKGLLMNHEVISLDQALLDPTPEIVSRDNGLVIIKRTLKGGKITVYGFFNLSDQKTVMSTTLPSDKPATLIVRDLWRNKDVGTIKTGADLKVEVNPHGATLLQLRGK